MADAAWKAVERRICELFGMKRRGPDGEGQSDCIACEDTVLPVSVQVKHSKRGSILTKWVEETKAQARKEDQPWILVVHKKGTRTEQSLCVVELSYLLEMRESHKWGMGAL